MTVRFVRLGLFAALLVGVILRALPALASPLPLGDGGLFLAMIEDIRATGVPPPETISYNGLDIPFVYPPLALVGAALFGNVSGAATLDLLRLVPVVMAIGGLLTFALLARAVLPGLAATGAVLSYALMPHAFDWVIAGGGLTRGLGLLLALVAMWTAVRSPLTLRSGAIVGVLLGLSALVHPQTPVFGALGCAVLAFPGRRELAGWAWWLAAAGITALIISLLWLVPATLVSGTVPILAAGHRLDPMGGLIRMFSFGFSGAAFMDLLTPLALAGLIVSILGRAPRLPVLIVLVYLPGAGGGDFMAVVVWSLLAGVGLAAVIRAGLHLAGGRAPRPAVAVALGATCLALAVMSAAGSTIHERSKLQAVSPEQAEAMRWVAAETDPDADFLVATIDTWGNDEVSEWFPALAERRSLGTVQGSEWLGREGFARQESVHLALVRCMRSTASCYRDAADAAGAADAYLFIPKGQLGGPLSASDCCPAARQTLEEAGYQVIYDGPGATIARPNG